MWQVQSCPVTLHDYHALFCLQQILCEHVGSSQWGDVKEEPGTIKGALAATSVKVQENKCWEYSLESNLLFKQFSSFKNQAFSSRSTKPTTDLKKLR